MPVPTNETSVQESANIVRSKLPPVQYPNMSMSEYISTRISKHPKDALAFLDPNNNYQLSYGELHSKCQEIAVTLLQLNLTSQDFLMFYADNSYEYCILLIAAVYLGLPYCPVPPASGAFELTEQIKGARGTVLVVGANKMKTIEKALSEDSYSQIMRDYLKVIIELDADKPSELLLENPIIAQKTVRSFRQIEAMCTGQQLKAIPHFSIVDPATSPYLICFTSGTTGCPKAALHTHRSLVCTLINAKFGSNDFGQRCAIWHPIGHISGSLMLPHALDIGLTIVLFAESNIDFIMECVPRLKLNQIFFSPNQASPLARNDYDKRYDLSSLISFKHGGSKIAENLLRSIKEKYQVKMWEMYGSTEFMAAVMVNDPEETWDNYQPGNCGTLRPNVEMKIVDLSTGKALPANEHGEICFRGPGCFAGYLNNEQATKNTIDADGWYHSGDIGYYNENGNLFISDRIKEMIKFKLYSLIPAEIEDFLHRHEAVAAVCVVGVPHLTDGNHIRAYVQLVEGKQITEQELVDYVAENMGSQKQLRAGVQFIASMPRTIIGKVDRQHFKRLVKDELLTQSC